MGLHPWWRRDLCSYIRGFVISVIKLVFFIIVGCWAAILAGALLYSMGYTLLAGPLGLDTTSPQWLLGASIWCFLCLLGSLYVVCQVHNRRKPKPDGPFKQYIKDKHNKVCSFIEFKD
jgi:hypothetical protein